MTERVVASRYRLTSPLGRGGMAVVWRAVDVLLGREVAVKTVDLTGPESEAWGERFRWEARATAALNHPNIVTVYDTGVEGHTAYLVMELLPGPTLAEQVRDRGVLPPAQVRSIGLQICSALAAAHAAGIVHRDIKPANVAYAVDGRIRVLDFGITQLMDDPGHALTRTNTVLGTADYLAPEQAVGGRVDERADLYALGCVLTTLLTGAPPYHGDTPVATMMQHAHEPVPDVRLLRPDAPADLVDLVGHLLAKDPADRPQSADVVAAMLRGEVRPAAPVTSVLPAATERLAPVTAPVGPVPPTGPQVVPEPARPAGPPPRRFGWVPWVILLLVVAVVVGYALTHRTGTPPPGQSTSSTPPANTSTSTSSSTTTTSSTSSSTTTTTSSTTSPPETTTSTTAGTDPATALADLRQEVATQAAAAAVDNAAKARLNAQLDKIDKALVGDGDRTKADKAVRDFGDLVQSLAQDGHVTQAGASALAGPYDALRSAVAG